jgi:hypothetical protein
LDQKPEKLGEAGFKIKRVVFYQELITTDPAVREEADPSRDDDYIVFGERGKYFTARVLGRRPGVDHISPVLGSEAIKFVEQSIGDLNHVRFKTKQNGKYRSFKLNDKSVNISLQNFYLETGELQ